MKNTKSKILSIIIIFMLTFNFIIMSCNYSYAEDSSAASLLDYGSKNETIDDIAKGSTGENMNSLLQNGTASSESENGKQFDTIKETATSFDMTGTALSIFFLLFPQICSLIMSGVANGNITKIFTIQNLLSGNYDIFDIDVFNANTSGVHKDALNSIRGNVAIWYVSIRNIAIVGTVIILVYIGIRMALAVVAEDKAKYKTMLVSWFVGFILIWVMQYIAMFLINISNIFVQLVAKAMQNESIKGLEEKVVNNTFLNVVNKSNANGKLFYLVLYYGFIIYQMKFFILYFTRMVKICFYVIISPLVCMTYSIDKVKDNKAQGFMTWFKDMAGEIFMQPIQLLLYTIFIYSAGAIVEKAPLIGLVFLGLLSHGEQITKKALSLAGGKGRDLKGTKLPIPKL